MKTAGIRRVRTRRLRLMALLPRIVFFGALVILAGVGVRTIVQPPEPPPAPIVDVYKPNLAAEATARAFARAYFTYDAEKPDARRDALAQVVGADSPLGTGAGFTPPEGRSNRVVGAEIVQARETDSGWVYSVAVESTQRPRSYLSVAIDSRGGTARVAGFPAIVGPPATDSATETAAPHVDDVDDDALEAVIERALRNYLLGPRGAENLLADLTDDAVVSPPAEGLQLTAVNGLSWSDPGATVAASVTATGADGATYRLAYELDVVQRDRWQVAAIQFVPTTTPN